MASPSVLRQWGGSSGNTPMTEPRRSPRLSGGRPDSRQSPVASRSALAATSANTKSPARRRSSLLVGGKRSLEPRASPAQAEEDELPEEMQGLQGTPSDSPAMKKARPSEARRASRVSFGGVELLRYDKNKTGLTPAVKSPVPVASTPMPPTEVSTVTEVSEVSEVSISSNEEGFYDCDSPSNSSEDEPTKNLKDLLAEEVTDMLGFTANLTESLATKLNAGEETAPTPRLSELGNFDNTENIQQTRTSSMGSAGLRTSMSSVGSAGDRVSMAPNTDTIAANMLSRPSMAPHAMGLGDTPTTTGPSLANLVKRHQGALDESQATGSIQDTSSPNASDDDLDGSMEMTECYGGGIVQTSQTSPAKPPVALSPNLAAASMTTLNVKPPESPNLKRLLRERAAGQHTAAAAIPSSPAPASPASSRRMSSIGTKIPTGMTVSPIGSSKIKPRMSTTPQAMNRRKGASVLAATEDIAPPSPVSDAAAPQAASPAMMRAGSRITMTESGTKPSPNPPRSPCRPSPMQMSPAQAALPMRSFDSNEEDSITGAPALTADQHADEVLGSFEAEEQEDESLHMPDHIPDTHVASPVPAAQVTRQSAGKHLKAELKRRSMAHAGQLPLSQPVDTNRSSSTKAICKTMLQFMAIADIHFQEDMSTNRRDTLCVRPGGNKAQECDLGEAIALSTTALPELRVMQEACDYLTSKIAQLQLEVTAAESACELNPPALFEELASDTRSEVATVIRGKLKTLKQTCRKQAKLEWYEWFKSIMDQVLQEALGEIDRLTKEASDLVTRAGQYADCEQKLHEYMSTLDVEPLAGRHLLTTVDEANALEKATAVGRQETTALEEQVAQLKANCCALQSRKDALVVSVEGLSSQKDYLMGESNGTSVSLEDATRAQQTFREQLNMQGVVLNTLKFNEIVMDISGAHRLTLMMEGANIAEAQLKVFETQEANSFGEVDDFWRGLVEDAEVESIVADLCGRHRSWIPHAVCELSLRLGRCHDLKDEVDSIRTSLKLLVERERGCITVYLSNLPLGRRLSVTFDELSWGYPSGEIAVDVKRHCGDITAAAAMDVVRGFKIGQYGRLYSTCEALVRLVAS